MIPRAVSPPAMRGLQHELDERAARAQGGTRRSSARGEHKHIPLLRSPSLRPARFRLSASSSLRLVLGTRIRDFRPADRYVEVKGLVERVAKSDSVIWPISSTEAHESLPVVLAPSVSDRSIAEFDGDGKKVRVVSTIDYYLVN